MYSSSLSKSVIITGASRGIGRACAFEFARNGYFPILIGNKSVDMLNLLQEELAAKGFDSYIITSDISYYGNVNDLFMEIEFQKLPTVEVLINNAGICHIGLLQDMSYEEWDNIIRTNLSSVFYMSKNVLPSMIRNGHGKILNVSSVWGNVGASCEVAYSATKGGIGSFTKALAKETAPSGIQVNAVAFGVIDTDMNNQLSTDEMQNLIDSIPANRIASTTEAAEMIYKTVNLPDYVTGQIITMDGGWI